MLNDFLQGIFDHPYKNLEYKVLKNALDLGIFEELQSGLTSINLAKSKSWNERNTHVFLQTLTSLGYLNKSGELFINSENTSRYLLKNKPEYIGTFVQVFESYIGQSFPDDFTELLENGPKPQAEVAEMDVDYEQMFNTLRAYQTGYAQVQYRNLLLEYNTYKKANKILDLGCGAGMIGLGFSVDNEHAEIVLYDLPHMTEAINTSVKIANIKNMVTVMGGDFSKDDIGSGYDLIFCSQAIYAAQHNLQKFMNKVYNALNNDGIFVCVSDGIKDDFSYPWDLVVSWLPFRMNNMDMSVKKDLVSSEGIKAGLTQVEKKHLHLMGGRLDIDIMKK